jgi:hypothetical protein
MFIHGVLAHHCAAGLRRCQKFHECHIDLSAILKGVFYGFSLFYQANAGIAPTYRSQPINFLHPSTQFYPYPCYCQSKRLLGTHGVLDLFFATFRTCLPLACALIYMVKTTGKHN